MDIPKSTPYIIVTLIGLFAMFLAAAIIIYKETPSDRQIKVSHSKAVEKHRIKEILVMEKQMRFFKHSGAGVCFAVTHSGRTHGGLVMAAVSCETVSHLLMNTEK